MANRGETCRNCESEYKQVYDVPDWMWAEVTGWKNGEGLLCMSCFDRLARQKGIIPFWSCGNKEYPV